MSTKIQNDFEYLPKAESMDIHCAQIKYITMPMGHDDW